MEESQPLLLDHGQPVSNYQHNESFLSIQHDRWRRNTRGFLSSKWGHYMVILLVTLDVTGIFLDFLLKLYICDHTCGKNETVSDAFPKAVSALEVISLVFSSLFVVELLASIWAFGLQSVRERMAIDLSNDGSFFKSWFRCLDATVIVVGFIIDVSLSGVEEEAGSIIVVLRFWRVIKIIEELR